LQGSGYQVKARTLHIAADTANASAPVSLSGAQHVQVAALYGSFRVTNSRGLLVAPVMPGTALDLEPQADGDTAVTQRSGCLRKTAGKFILTDDTTNVTVVTGVTVDAQPVEGATQIISIAIIKRLGKGCGSSAKKAGAAAGGGWRGVAAAGTRGGLGVAGALPGQDEEQRNASR